MNPNFLLCLLNRLCLIFTSMIVGVLGGAARRWGCGAAVWWPSWLAERCADESGGIVRAAVVDLVTERSVGSLKITTFEWHFCSGKVSGILSIDCLDWIQLLQTGEFMKPKFFKTRCSQCRTEIPKGSPLIKYVKMADGSWHKVCRRCYSAMGSPGPINRTSRDKWIDPNQGRLW